MRTDQNGTAWWVTASSATNRLLIGFVVSRSRNLLRRLLKEHAPDDARQELAEGIVTHLEQSGFELDEEGRALRKRPPLEPHGMARGE